MMRSPGHWALAVRKPDGEIAELNRPIRSPMARHRIFRLPVIRGVVALGESLAIGFRALAISANYAAQDPEQKDGEVSTELSRGSLIFAFAIAIGFAVMLFKVTPALITNWLPVETTGAFVVVEGLIRVTIFIAYLALISLLPDLRRVFQYHAAEHKTINAYEAGEPLEPERVQRLDERERGTAGGASRGAGDRGDLGLGPLDPADEAAAGARPHDRVGGVGRERGRPVRQPVVTAPVEQRVGPVRVLHHHRVVHRQRDVGAQRLGEPREVVLGGVAGIQDADGGQRHEHAHLSCENAAGAGIVDNPTHSP